jgi:hypothetical protein
MKRTTYFKAGDEQNGKTPFVRVSTYKNSRGNLETIACLVFQEKMETVVFESTHIFKNGLFTLLSEECKRVTEKQVNRQHEAALSAYPESSLVAYVLERVKKGE